MKQHKSPISSHFALETSSINTNREDISQNSQPFQFVVAFEGFMDMYGDTKAVAEYLNAHEGWFCRCARPMKVEPLGNNGYILNVGRFASLGYEVEPKMAVVLDPPQENLYVMRTIPIPDYTTPGYEVQYKAIMELTEVSIDRTKEQSLKKILAKKSTIPPVFTRVSWQLGLIVTVEFPRFIKKLPVNLVQNTGDRLLAQIVRQVSPRLTYKVQQDFHSANGLPLPAKSGRGLSKMARECEIFVSPRVNKNVNTNSSTQESSKSECAA